MGLDVRLMCWRPALYVLRCGGSACSVRAAILLPRTHPHVAALHAAGRPGRGLDGVCFFNAANKLANWQANGHPLVDPMYAEVKAALS